MVVQIKYQKNWVFISSPAIIDFRNWLPGSVYTSNVTLGEALFLFFTPSTKLGYFNSVFHNSANSRDILWVKNNTYKGLRRLCLANSGLTDISYCYHFCYSSYTVDFVAFTC